MSGISKNVRHRDRHEKEVKAKAEKMVDRKMTVDRHVVRIIQA